MGLFTEHSDRIGELEEKIKRLQRYEVEGGVSMSCGHPVQAAYAGNYGKGRCRWCEEVEQLKSDLAEANEDECKFREKWGKVRNDLQAAREDIVRLQKENSNMREENHQWGIDP